MKIKLGLISLGLGVPMAALFLCLDWWHYSLIYCVETTPDMFDFARAGAYPWLNVALGVCLLISWLLLYRGFSFSKSRWIHMATGLGMLVSSILVTAIAWFRQPGLRWCGNINLWKSFRAYQAQSIPWLYCLVIVFILTCVICRKATRKPWLSQNAKVLLLYLAAFAFKLLIYCLCAWEHLTVGGWTLAIPIAAGGLCLICGGLAVFAEKSFQKTD